MYMDSRQRSRRDRDRGAAADAAAADYAKDACVLVASLSVARRLVRHPIETDS